MKEIKFRAWNKLLKMMSEVSSIHFGLNIIETYEPDLEVDFEDVELMQYTGLKDKNGKDIYEGDIVTWGYGNTKVRFGKLQYEDCCYAYGWIVDDCFLDEKCEVIGNIRENPELLEAK